MRRLPATSVCPQNERHQNLSNQAMKLAELALARKRMKEVRHG
jgi:hypothetical protein